MTIVRPKSVSAHILMLLRLLPNLTAPQVQSELRKHSKHMEINSVRSTLSQLKARGSVKCHASECCRLCGSARYVYAITAKGRSDLSQAGLI